MFREVGLTTLNLGPKPVKRPATPKSAAPKKKVKKEVSKEPAAPRRTSARLAGIVADSEVQHHKYEEELAAQQELERLKRLRRSGDFRLSDLKDEDADADATQTMLKELARLPFDRDEFERETEGVRKELQEIRREMSQMKLFERWRPNDIEMTPDRIYSIGMHPSSTKPIVFAGDKIGNLGIWDVWGSVERDDEQLPLVTNFKLHARTIPQFTFSPTDATRLYTASYDTTIRVLDLTTQQSTEVYFPPSDDDTDALISSLQIQPNGNILLFSNMSGEVGKLDLREPVNNRKTKLYALHEKKIGGLSVFPGMEEIIATSSLDRTMKIWDLRKLSDKIPVLCGEYEATKSISSADFNRQGDIVATSYDDTLSFFNNVVSSATPVAKDLGSLVPSERVVHNNQTGRYVSVFKTRWQERPENGFEKCCVGNMQRYYSGGSD
jgi:WD repeat-containing protein 76